MKTRLHILTIAAAITALAFGSSAHAQSDDSEKMPEAITVLKKFADVTGGAANYKKVKAIKMSGTLEIAVAGINGTIEILQVSPDKMATKAEMDQVGSQSQGTNGKVGWDVSTMMGPRVLEKNELERLKDQANLARIYDPAKYYKEMKVVGTEETNGEKCYKLKMTKQNGDESIEFYSVESGFQISSTSTMETQMGAMEIQSFVSDYKEVGGIKLPHKLEVKFPNGMVQAVAFDKVEVNPEVDEKMFEVPEEVKALLPGDDEKGDEKSEGEDK